MDNSCSIITSTTQKILSLSMAEEIVANFDCSVHIKELKSGKYVASNSLNLSIFGLNAADSILGLTLQDMDYFMNPFWGNNAIEVQDYDDQVCHNGNLVTDLNRSWLNQRGLIWRHKMYKLPVVGNDGLLKYVLTISKTSDKLISIKQLYLLYFSIYPKDRNRRMTKFLEHIGVLHFFHKNDLPTETEIEIIFLKKDFYSNKEISYKRNVSEKTIEKQISSIQDKIVSNFRFTDLLRQLHTQYS